MKGASAAGVENEAAREGTVTGTDEVGLAIGRTGTRTATATETETDDVTEHMEAIGRVIRETGGAVIETVTGIVSATIRTESDGAKEETIWTIPRMSVIMQSATKGGNQTTALMIIHRRLRLRRLLGDCLHRPRPLPHHRGTAPTVGRPIGEIARANQTASLIGIAGLRVTNWTTILDTGGTGTIVERMIVSRRWTMTCALRIIGTM